MLFCPECHKKTRSFWEKDFDFSCINCREKQDKADKEKLLIAAFKAGKVKESDLTPLGRSVCGLS